jgi:predicted molibdopterin-dependent oxidoreductase YjgC
LDILKQEGINVPTMCFLDNEEHFPTCMICIVKDQKTDKLIPSCSTRVATGMDIISDDEEVIEARKTGLELLLSDHIGECDAPCQTNCPAFMDIPLMNRLLANGQFDEALRVVKKDIALPAVLGRICPAPVSAPAAEETSMSRFPSARLNAMQQIMTWSTKTISCLK